MRDDCGPAGKAGRASNFDGDPGRCGPPAWKERLQTTNNGGYRTNLANACIAPRHAPELKGCIGFDTLGLQTMVLQPLPWDASIRRPWTPIDDLRFAEWLQTNGPNIGVRIAQQAVESVAHEREFHPVQGWPEERSWDGTPRSRLLASERQPRAGDR